RLVGSSFDSMDDSVLREFVKGDAGRIVCETSILGDLPNCIVSPDKAFEDGLLRRRTVLIQNQINMN
ncbi:unnamed protein product, partial [marine sediment metagenome]